MEQVGGNRPVTCYASSSPAIRFRLLMVITASLSIPPLDQFGISLVINKTWPAEMQPVWRPAAIADQIKPNSPLAPSTDE